MSCSSLLAQTYPSVDPSEKTILIENGRYTELYAYYATDGAEQSNWDGYNITIKNTFVDPRFAGIYIDDAQVAQSFNNNKMYLDGLTVDSGNDAGLIYADNTNGDLSAANNFTEYKASSAGNFKSVLLITYHGNATAAHNELNVISGTLGEPPEEIAAKFNNVATVEVRTYDGIASATDNILRIDSLKAASTATAGRSTVYSKGISANSDRNKLYINGTAYAKQLFSGYAVSNTTAGPASADGNQLFFNSTFVDSTGEKLFDLIVAGFSQTTYANASTTNNSLTISAASTMNNAIAGWSYGTRSGATFANINTITVDADATIKTLYGGYAYSTASTSGTANGEAVANQNLAYINAGHINNAYGGQAVSASKSTAYLNHVFVTNGIIQRVIGGYATTLNGASPTHLETSENTVEIKGGAITESVYGGYINLPISNEAASELVAVEFKSNGNRVDLVSGEVKGDVYGGFVAGTANRTEANNNKVFVGEGVDLLNNSVVGGMAVNGPGGAIVEAVGNTVTIDGKAVDSVCGGYAESVIATSRVGGESAELKSNENRVELLSGEVKGDVYGGFAAGSIKAETRNNVVFVNEGIDLSNASLYGGSHESTGNVLHVGGFTGDVKTIKNFESIRMNVTEKDLGNTTALISISEDIDTTTRVDVDVNVSKLPSRESSVLLLSGSNADQLDQGNINLVDPVYEIDAAFDASVSDELSLTLSGKTVSDDTSVLSSGQIASAMDLDRGIGLLIDYFKDDLNVRRGLFVVAGGGQNEFDDWGSIEASGVNLIFGATGSTDVGATQLTGSVFFDYGRGDYEAEHGGYADGDFEHYGFGLYGKLKYAPAYVDASVRAGFAETEYLSVLNDISIGMSDTRRSYFSAHVGLGGDFVLSERLTINPFAQYFITRLGSHSEGIENNNIHWDSFIMQKTVLGIGANSRWTERFGTRLSAAWENIFDAGSEISFGEGGSRIDDYKGNNLLLQASAQYAPTENISIGMRIQGRMGDYKGIEGLLNAQYLF